MSQKYYTGDDSHPRLPKMEIHPALQAVAYARLKDVAVALIEHAEHLDFEMLCDDRDWSEFSARFQQIVVLADGIRDDLEKRYHVALNQIPGLEETPEPETRLAGVRALARAWS